MGNQSAVPNWKSAEDTPSEGNFLFAVHKPESAVGAERGG